MSTRNSFTPTIVLLLAALVLPGCRLWDATSVVMANSDEPGSGLTKAESAPAFRFVTGMDLTAPAAQVRPPLNEPFTDGAYGTRVTRVMDASQVTDRDTPSFVRHEYSRRPAFNADTTRALAISSNGSLRLFSVDKAGNKMSFVKTLGISEPQEPNWHPTDPNVIYFLGTYGQSLQIGRYDVATDQSTVARDLTERIRAIFPAANGMWTKQEGRPSNDGRIWSFQIEDSDFGILGILTYDFEQDLVLGSLAVEARPDHVSTSPLGNFCVASWAYRPDLGTRSYSLDFSRFTQLHNQSEHSDLAVTKDGREVYVLSDYSSGDVAMVDLETGVRTNLFRLYGADYSATAMHFSGIGSQLTPGYILTSFYKCTQNYGADPGDFSSQWFKDKVVLVELTAEPRIYNLAHTHFGDAGYFSETQAVASKDFGKVLFVSTWESTQERDVSSYMVDVPVSALP